MTKDNLSLLFPGRRGGLLNWVLLVIYGVLSRAD
jgi:hypothetical protein